MICDVEHHFLCLLAICVSSLKKRPSRSSAYVLIGLFGFLFLFGVKLCEFFNILDINPYNQMHQFANIFSHLIGSLFGFVMVSVAV